MSCCCYVRISRTKFRVIALVLTRLLLIFFIRAGAGCCSPSPSLERILTCLPRCNKLFILNTLTTNPSICRSSDFTRLARYFFFNLSDLSPYCFLCALFYWSWLCVRRHSCSPTLISPINFFVSKHLHCFCLRKYLLWTCVLLFVDLLMIVLFLWTCLWLYYCLWTCFNFCLLGTIRHLWLFQHRKPWMLLDRNKSKILTTISIL